MSILVSILVLGVMIWVHELGHYWAARHYGVQVLRFSIGFGPKIFSWENDDACEFRIAAIPLGGYVQMLERDMLKDPKSRLIPLCFQSKRLSARAVIIAAGPIANILLALLLNAIIHMGGFTYVVPKIGELTPGSPAEQAGLQAGQIITAVDGQPVQHWREVTRALVPRLGHTGTIVFQAEDPDGWRGEYQLEVEAWLSDDIDTDPITSLGLSTYSPPIEPVVAEVVAGSAASVAGLQPGDRIIAVNGIAISDWQLWAQLVRANPGNLLLVNIERGEQQLLINMIPQARRDQQDMAIGVAGVRAQSPDYPQELLIKQSYGPLAALWQSLGYTYELGVTILTGIGKLLTGQLSLEHISGPITIVQVIDQSAQSGLFSLLALSAYISLSLAILNLLPIPVLDGGHLMLLAYEAIAGRPLNQKLVRRISYVGMVFLLSLMLFATYNDLLRL